MSTDTTADVIVVGLGAIGAATTYQLAKSGARVIGIDRFSPPHTHGSSHGATRITRLAIGEGDEYVPLARRSHDIWRELESASGETLYRATGGLIFGAATGTAEHHGKLDFVRRTIDCAERYGISHDVLGAQAIADRFPAFQLKGDELGYYEPEAGVVFPEACVRVQLDEARKCGATLQLDEQVIDIDGSASGATVRTSRAVYRASNVVVAAGPWLPQLLGGVYKVRLKVLRQVLYWFRTDQPQIFSVGQFPIFIRAQTVGEAHLYGFPMVDGFDGVKVATEQYEVQTEPDHVVRNVASEEVDHMYKNIASRRLRGLKPELLRAATCMYTVSPDSGFLFDRHPERPSVWVVSACSGHAFKHSAGLGEAISRVVLGQADADLSVFSSHRFEQHGAAVPLGNHLLPR